jgi:uncharacterized coiled-coil protein SlyX
MGFLWDLIQQSQIHEHRKAADTLEQRVAALERELDETRALLRMLLERLETRLGEDLDDDGQIG